MRKEETRARQGREEVRETWRRGNKVEMKEKGNEGERRGGVVTKPSTIQLGHGN